MDALAAGWMGAVAREAAEVRDDLAAGLYYSALDLPADVKIALRILSEEQPEPKQQNG